MLTGSFLNRGMVIIIFGFSGAGKSTLADKLGTVLNVRVIHPSSIVRNLLENKEVDLTATTAGVNFWESQQGERLFKGRLQAEWPIDLVSDEILLGEIQKGNLVMDSWSMPWLSPVGIKIFLTASHDIRARRVARRSGVSLKRASHIVRLKDRETRKLYRRYRGFDMKNDRSVFMHSIDTNRLRSDVVFKKVLSQLDKIKKAPEGAQ